MELTSKSRLPRLVKERIICEYLSGSKTVQMLSEEYGMSRNAINHMVSRHKGKFSPTFEAKPILPAMNPKKTTEEATEKLLQETRNCVIA
jgi:transposase-like protein